MKNSKSIRLISCGMVFVLLVTVLLLGMNANIRKQERYDSATKAMVYLTCQGYGGNGSVFLMDEEELVIVTTYHLLQESEEVMVYFHDQTIVPGKVLFVNQEHDVGFVTVDTEELTQETIQGIATVWRDTAVYDGLESGDIMEYRFLEWNGGNVSATMNQGSIGHMNWYIEDLGDYFIYNYCDVNPGMSGCAAVAEDGTYIGMMIGGVDNESGALSVKVIEDLLMEWEWNLG